MSRDPNSVPHEDFARSMEGPGYEFFSFINGGTKQFLHLPWANLDKLVGGILPGELHYFCAFTGNGKTLFTLSLVLEMAAQGWKVYYMGLEQTQMKLMTLMSCMLAGVDSAAVLKGTAFARADWRQVSERMAEKAVLIQTLPIYLSPVEAVSAKALEEAVRHCDRIGADVLIVDHVDHGLEGENMYNESYKVNKTLHRLAKASGVRAIPSSQLNLDVIRQDPFGKYRPPQLNHVTLGNKKAEMADGMWGIYAPFDPTKVTPEAIKAVRAGQRKARDLLLPWTMGINNMKDRKGGPEEYALLSTRGRRVSNLEERDLYSTTDWRGGP